MLDYEGKDGLARDIGKLRHERKEMKRTNSVHYKRRRKAKLFTPDWFHANTNVWVEERRSHPYYTGHRDMFIAWAYRAAILGLLIAGG